MLKVSSSCRPVIIRNSFRATSSLCRHHRLMAMTTPVLNGTQNLTSPSAADCTVEQVVRKIHASPYEAAFVLTGGAVQAVQMLMTVPGASNTVLDMHLPYSRNSMLQLLGQEPDQYCSEATAVSCAQAAYRKAADLSSFGEPILGVGATCSLASEPPKRGAHRVFVATHDGINTRTVHLHLAKGARSRFEEDAVASKLVIQCLATACGISSHGLELGLIKAADGNGKSDVIEEHHAVLADPLAALLEGRVRTVEFSNRKVVVDAPRHGRVYLPGSFNPLHDGHKQLLAVACGIRGKNSEGCFELSVGNADKGLLPLEEIRRRVQQFIDERLPVVVTSAPLFINKATLFSGSSFVVGFDTAHRLLMEKYYDDSEEKMLAAFDRLRHTGCNFIVAGRQGQNGEFKHYEDLKVPAPLQDLFTGISEQEFRIDISSTALRQRMGLNH